MATVIRKLISSIFFLHLLYYILTTSVIKVFHFSGLWRSDIIRSIVKLIFIYKTHALGHAISSFYGLK